MESNGVKTIELMHNLYRAKTRSVNSSDVRQYRSTEKSDCGRVSNKCKTLYSVLHCAHVTKKEDTTPCRDPAGVQQLCLCISMRKGTRYQHASHGKMRS